MKKYTRDFLFNLENKTTIKFDWSNLKPTEKYVQQNNQAVEADTMLINKKLITIVISCGCKTCKEVIGLQIFYGLGESSLIDAETVMNQIKIVAPMIPIELYNLFDLKSIGL